MAAVSAEDLIGNIEMRANTGRNRFLADVGMASAVDESTLVRPGQLFFAAPNEKHSSVEAQDLILA